VARDLLRAAGRTIDGRGDTVERPGKEATGMAVAFFGTRPVGAAEPPAVGEGGSAAR
jgi:hypothetical protein